MSCRVFVQVWCEVDPTLNVRVDRQSGMPIVDAGDMLMRVSPLGRAGVLTALGIPRAEVTAFCLGEGHEAALRHALAAGASHAIQLNLPNSDANADWAVPLAEWLREQKPGLVIADRMAGRLAARLGWAHLAGLGELQIADGRLKAIRHLGRGDCESVTATLPASVRLQTEALSLRYVAQARIDAAANLDIQLVSLQADIGARKDAELGPLQPSRPRTKLGTAPAAAPTSGLDRLSALMGVGRAPAAPAVAAEPANKTPDQLADEFVRYLAHHNLLND